VRGLVAPFVWILAIVSVRIAAGDCPAPTDAERRQAALEALRAGEEMLAARNWNGAAERFTSAAGYDPLLPLAPYGLGQAHMGAQRYAGAVQAFSESRDAFRCLASASAADRADARKRLEDQIRQVRDALRNLERERLIANSMKWKEINDHATGSIGEAALQAQRIEAALRELEQWKDRLAHAEVPAEVYHALGNAYFQSGSLPDAEREFLTALRANPKSGDVQNNIAVVYMLTGRLDEAEQAMKRAEKAGVPVSDRLREEIRRRRAGNLPSR